jgi:Fungalysin/Thermolysin Propeptide Motif
MRSIFGRTSLPLVALLLVSSIEVVARADTQTIVTRGGAPWLHVGGVYAGPKTADLDVRARAIVAQHVKVAPSALVKSGIDRFGDGDTVVRYQQSHHGLPVIGRGAAVRLSAAGQPVATVLDLESELPAQTTAAVTSIDAASIASTRSTIGASSKDAHLVVWPTLDRGARLAWAVLPHVPVGLPTRPRVIVDAETGEVLEARDMVTFATANMFQFNPTKTPGPKPRDLPMASSGVTLTNAFLESTNCIDKKTVKPVSMFGFNLDVHICDLVQTATANAEGNFIYEPSDEPGSTEARSDTFSEVSIYYHASEAYNFFRRLQGELEAQVVVDKPLRLVANLQMPAGMMSGDLAMASNPDIPLETFQNAFFSPADGGLGALFQQLYGFNSGALWFGQGPKRDYAYDGDVVYHEFGHAVIDATIKLGAWHVDKRGAIDAPGAMNEGLADYFSSAITGDPDVGEYASADMGAADNSVIRTLANSDRCSSVIGEVHADSTVFSGALWSARSALGEGDRSKFDAALYKALRTNPGRGDLGYEDLAKLFIETLKTDLPSGASALEASMTERGLLPWCERVEPYTGTPRRSSDPRIGFAAPGKQSVSIKGMAPGIFQLSAPLPASTSSMTVSFKVRSSGGGQSPLGGGGDPFTPVVLAKLDAPITWDSKTGHDATFKITTDASSDTASATIAIPEGTPEGTIYVQIANAGDSDGYYDDVALAFTSTPGVGGDDTAPPPPTTTSRAADDSGCNTSNSKPSTAIVPGLVAAAALVTAFRRRRSTAR